MRQGFQNIMNSNEIAINHHNGPNFEEGQNVYDNIPLKEKPRGVHDSYLDLKAKQNISPNALILPYQDLDSQQYCYDSSQLSQSNSPSIHLASESESYSISGNYRPSSDTSVDEKDLFNQLRCYTIQDIKDDIRQQRAINRRTLSDGLQEFGRSRSNDTAVCLSHGHRKTNAVSLSSFSMSNDLHFLKSPSKIIDSSDSYNNPDPFMTMRDTREQIRRNTTGQYGSLTDFVLRNKIDLKGHDFVSPEEPKINLDLS